LTGCGKDENKAEVTDDQEPVAVSEEIGDENDIVLNEKDEEAIEPDPAEMEPEELFNAFCEGQISAEAVSYYDDTTWTMDAGDYQFYSDTIDEYDATIVVERREPVDLDNDGEVEFVLSNPVYGDMCFDCKDGKVICFAQGEGTTAYCSYTQYDDAYWIVHSDTSHAGRCTYDLVRFNGELEVEDSFCFGWEDWEDDGIKRFYKDDQDITEAEYDKLFNQVFNE